MGKVGSMTQDFTARTEKGEYHLRYRKGHWRTLSDRPLKPVSTDNTEDAGVEVISSAERSVNNY